MSILINTNRLKRNKDKVLIRVGLILIGISVFYGLNKLECFIKIDDTSSSLSADIVSTLSTFKYFTTVYLGICFTNLYNCLKVHKELLRVIDVLSDCCTELEGWIIDVKNQHQVRSMRSFMNLIGKQIKVLVEISNKDDTDDKAENKNDILKAREQANKLIPNMGKLKDEKSS